jgi:putative nucleotidyltransferase with HDIG domain
VDDEPAVCELIAAGLSGHKFNCFIETISPKAARLLSEQPFDLLIADIAMPDMTGLDLLAIARRERPHCRVILTTGAPKREYLAQALMLGAYDYVEKPFDVDKLREVAVTAIENPEQLPRLPSRAADALHLDSQAKQASFDGVRALARAVEAKDPYTRWHSEQVAYYAGLFAEILKLPPSTIESIRVSSLLHDIGKIGVPDSILTKAGRLDGAEMEHIRRHPNLGAEILSKITLFNREAQLVRSHHENWDGSGYPSGLSGEEIPLGARIIQISDCMDAMLMNRTYKNAYPPEKMMGELVRCAGSMFDPKIAAMALEWSRSNPDKLITPTNALAGSTARN